MEHSHSSINALAQDVKENIFLNVDPYALIATSAYDTAWLAMVPNNSDPSQPMFESCLNWVLTNQHHDGFWGECDGHGEPTIECLTATIACMVALKKWNVGQKMINRGMDFIGANAEDLVKELIYDEWWFAIIFPAMLEFAHENGLHLVFSDHLKATFMHVFYKRQEIFQREKVVEKQHYPPLISYLETLPLYNIDKEDVAKNLCNDGSLFQSPSATAQAFMATGNKDCLAYMQSLVQKCPNGVPPTYPIDEQLIKLSMVNQIQKLGLSEHFHQEIQQVLKQVHRNYMNQDSRPKQISSVARKLYKDSLAFWLLRMHGYNVSPRIFCWFLHDEEIKDHIQKNSDIFSSVMLIVHKATDLMFPGEYELEEAKLFSRNLLEKSIPMETGVQKNYSFLNFHNVIKHELRFPWLARLDHLEHRMWIEERNNSALWMEKASFVRLSLHHHDKLKKLAIKNYEFRQSIYMNELEKLKRWSKFWGLTEMGFGREKTTYCYFATAASASLPHDSDVRTMASKSAIIITVADDFYDSEGSLDQLEKLTDAIQRWDGKGLSGHSKTIFNVLDDLVREMSEKYLKKHGTDDITNSLRFIWYETFNAWLTEAKWSRSGFIPSTQEYLETGMTSIATHTMVLPCSCFLKPSLPKMIPNPTQHETVTKLVMIIPRLLNDIQSYEKEMKEGKINMVLLHMKENPEAEIEDSIAHVKQIINQKKKEFMKQALMDDINILPKEFRHFHLSCLKAFQMFFNSSNEFDSTTTKMLQDIQNAIYLPIQVNKPKPPLQLIPEAPKRLQTVASYRRVDHRLNHYNINYTSKRNISIKRRSVAMSAMPLSFGLCFI
ncbi:(E,E)-geranyllinalool synthase-like [Mercurialis annua]|uniref:(E,E)-geranyllinalool synthase-like n=1 Tax=Mercurialis annua TaxID=3986 RepID=UPI00215F96E0|nr:(E,E)-geranyllinalool synthase-like [Mercurialis annua]